MKKIGIVTIVDYKNYGNRLQNFALQEVLKSIGYNVVTIKNKPLSIKSKKNERIYAYINDLTRLPRKKIIQEVFKKIKLQFKKNKIKKLRENKVKNFKEFTNEYIEETELEYTAYVNDFSELRNYDYFIAGSDQIWNPNFRNGSEFDFLTFTEKEKRIAYAPSFGVSEIPHGYTTNYAKWISEIPHISVREEAGAQIIKKLTGKDAQVVVDPTLLVSKDKWTSIAKASKNKTNKKFLLTYFLGDLTVANAREIKNLALKEDLEIVNLANIENPEIYAANPSEFLDYINSAEAFLTDSFHGVVFSIIFNTPFVVYERQGKTPSMNSRINNLLSLFNLNNRKKENLKSLSEAFETDYSHIKPILEVERKKAYKFLEDSLV